ncbi:MAG: N-glycosylase/DNA lyase [Candidatus Hadarchaeales archaeon]
MDELISRILELKRSEVGAEVRRRVREFRALNLKGNREWFSELCFCILTANATAESGMRAQALIGANGFLELPEKDLARELRRSGYRFPESRAKYIAEARKKWRIKDVLQGFKDPSEARVWLVENIIGIGWKEASHFLRNVGYLDFAILDRHILSIFCQHGLIDRIPRYLSKRVYLEIEKKAEDLAGKVGMKLGELDLYLWCMKTGKVLK